MAIVAAIAIAFATLVATALHAPVGSLILFACWSATLGVAFRYGPAVWRSEVEYVVTEKHVMWKRGRIRRTIDRGAISYARIHWHPSIPGLGDLELVRAVPTGALRRRLSLQLPGIMGPDRLWAIIRGVPASGGAGDGSRPLAQRLDDGERVLWSARPTTGWREWLPAGRQLVTAAIGALVAVAFVRELKTAVPAARHVIAGGLSAHSPGFIALIMAVALTAVLLACVAVGLGYVALVRPARLVQKTRYLITDRRVLIQRGNEELCLDRERIVDVIDSPAQQRGLHDIFLVLDGPRARALAASGAFGERDIENGLVPVFHSVPDADEVSEILRFRRSPPPPLDDAA
jgi:hypothetical protein